MDSAAAGNPAENPKESVGSHLAQICRDLWTYRELLFQLTLRDVRIRYKQAAMGFGWALLMPLFVVLAGVLVRFAMAMISGRSLPTASIAGLAVKAVPWSFFVGALSFASTSLVGNSNLVTKIYFPREVLPLSSTFAQAFDTTIGAVAVTLLLPFLGVTPSWTVLWVPLLAVILFAFTAASALAVGCANLFFRDVKYIVQVLLTFGIFFTPVFFEPAMFGAKGAELMMLNPLAPILEGIRLAVVEGHNLLEPLTVNARHGLAPAWEPWYLAYSAAWAVTGLLVSAYAFHRLEFVFAEYV